MAGAAAPFWIVASRRVRKVVTTRYVPMLAVGAAYSFLVMMFNVPVPDGTSAHAVGGVLIACILGPWAAILAVSVALAIQALFFGDGGVLAYGANVFNLAVVMPLVGYGVYRLIARNAALDAPRRAVAAGIGAYVGINAAAFCAAIQFGVQPDLFHSANGTPLYAPFHLSHAIPGMMFAHLLIAGPVEFLLTTGVMRYLQRANVPLLRANHPGIGIVDGDGDGDGDDDDGATPRLPWRWATTGLIAMVLLSPIGLLATGDAFGESSPGDLDLGGFGLAAVPHGLNRYFGFFQSALLPEYGLAGTHPVVGYLVSAVIGVAVIFGVIGGAMFVGRRVRRPRQAAKR